MYNYTPDGKRYLAYGGDFGDTPNDGQFADFKAVKNGNVWCTGKYLFQATDITGELIVDFHHMLTGQEDMQFLYKLK